MGQKYSQLTAGDRNQFYALRKAKIPMTEIAKQLNRSRTTLYNELARNAGGRGYRPKQAQEFARQRRAEKVVPLIMAPDVIAYIEYKLRRQWSPEQIANYTKTKFADQVTDEILRMLIGEVVETVTFDNGKEFAGHERIAAKLDCQCFFAKPYHSWERGANENVNGLIRQYFPKKMLFDKITPVQIAHVQHRLNTRPRKCLGYKLPDAVYFDYAA